MPKISAELDALITAQEAEIARIQTQSAADLQAAKDRLQLLKRARGKVTDDLDDLADTLRANGIWPRG